MKPTGRRQFVDLREGAQRSLPVVVCRPFRSPVRASPICVSSASASMLTSVDLPAPDGPSKATVCPEIRLFRTLQLLTEIGLGQHEFKQRATFPRHREIALQTSEVRTSVERLNNPQPIYVRREHLLGPRLAGRGPAAEWIVHRSRCCDVTRAGSPVAAWRRSKPAAQSSSQPSVRSEFLIILPSYAKLIGDPATLRWSRAGADAFAPVLVNLVLVFTIDKAGRPCHCGRRA